MVAAEATGKEKPARLLVVPIPRSRASARPAHIGCFCRLPPRREEDGGRLLDYYGVSPGQITSLNREPPNAGCTAKESEETPEERPIEEGSEGNQ